MNLWPFKHMPSLEHICPLCGYHMLKPIGGEPYCATSTCKEGEKNHERAKG